MLGDDRSVSVPGTRRHLARGRASTASPPRARSSAPMGVAPGANVAGSMAPRGATLAEVVEGQRRAPVAPAGFAIPCAGDVWRGAVPGSAPGSSVPGARSARRHVHAGLDRRRGVGEDVAEGFGSPPVQALGSRTVRARARAQHALVPVGRAPPPCFSRPVPEHVRRDASDCPLVSVAAGIRARGRAHGALAPARVMALLSAPPRRRALGARGRRRRVLALGFSRTRRCPRLRAARSRAGSASPGGRRRGAFAHTSSPWRSRAPLPGRACSGTDARRSRRDTASWSRR